MAVNPGQLRQSNQPMHCSATSVDQRTFELIYISL